MPLPSPVSNAPGPLFLHTPLYQPARLDQMALLAINEQAIPVPLYCNHSIGSLQGQRVTECLRSCEQRRILLKHYCADHHLSLAHIKAFSFNYQFLFAKPRIVTESENPLQQAAEDSMLEELRTMLANYDENYLVVKYFLDEEGMQQLSKLHELLDNPKGFIANPDNQAVQYLKDTVYKVECITDFLYEHGPTTRSSQGTYSDTRYVQLLHIVRVMQTIDAILREGNLKQRTYVLQNISLRRMDKAINCTINYLNKKCSYITYLGNDIEEVREERKAFFERAIDLLVQTQDAINLYQEDQPDMLSYKETIYATYYP